MSCRWERNAPADPGLCEQLPEASWVIAMAFYSGVGDRFVSTGRFRLSCGRDRIRWGRPQYKKAVDRVSGVVTLACNCSTQEPESGGQEFLVSLRYIVRPWFQKPLPHMWVYIQNPT